MERRDDAALLLARILMSALFIADGLAKFPGYAGSLAYFQAKGMPLLPFTLWLAIVIQLGGGLAVLVGWRAREAALALALYCVVATLVGHAFWAMAPSGARINEMYHFGKDLGLAGGFMVLAVAGAGRLSVDAWRAARPLMRGSASHAA